MFWVEHFAAIVQMLNIMAQDLKARLEFIGEMDKLKSIERRTSIYDQSRLENTAEHSWHLATAVLVLQPFAIEPINMELALKMALLHDVVEIDAGDTFVYDLEAAKSKSEREVQAAHRIFGLLPEQDKKLMHGLWLRFEKQECPESRYVAAIDRFLPIYANLQTDGFSWKKHKVSKSQVLARNVQLKLAIPALWNLTLEYLEQAVAKGFLIDA